MRSRLSRYSRLAPVRAAVAVAVAMAASSAPLHAADVPEGMGRLVVTPRLTPEGAVAPVRVSVRGADGQYVAPHEAIVIPSWAMSFAYWHEESTLREVERYNRDPRDPYSLEGERFAYVPGRFQVDVPPGEAVLRVYHGTEYVPAVRTVSVEAGQTRELTVELSRWTPAPEGWYTGDMHLHAARTPQRDPLIFLMMQAEDVHVLFPQLLMTDGVVDDFRQPALGEAGAAHHGRHALYSGEEYRNGELGHYTMLGIHRVVEPIGSGLYHGGKGSPNYPGATAACLDAMGQGPAVLCQPDHGGSAEAFVALACGGINAWEVLQASHAMTEDWLLALRAGYRLPPTAGSDYPYLASHPARERNYVRVDGEPTMRAFLEALLAGRTYATRGPVLGRFRVGGREMGENLVLDRPGPVRVEAEIRWFAPIGQLAVLVNGHPAARIASETDTTLRIDQEVPIERGGFVLLQAGGLLVTAPVYVRVGEQSPVDVAAVNRMAEEVRQGMRFVRERATFSADAQGADATPLYFENAEQQQAVLANFEKALQTLEQRTRDAQGARPP